MATTLDDPAVRVQLFRFIDVLPALKTAPAVRRHLAEYLDEAGDRVPWWLRAAVALAPAGSEREEMLAATLVTTALAAPVIVIAAFVETYASPHLLLALLGG